MDSVISSNFMEPNQPVFPAEDAKPILMRVRLLSLIYDQIRTHRAELTFFLHHFLLVIHFLHFLGRNLLRHFLVRVLRSAATLPLHHLLVARRPCIVVKVFQELGEEGAADQRVRLSLPCSLGGQNRKEQECEENLEHGSSLLGPGCCLC